MPQTLHLNSCVCLEYYIIDQSHHISHTSTEESCSQTWQEDRFLVSTYSPYKASLQFACLTTVSNLCLLLGYTWLASYLNFQFWTTFWYISLYSFRCRCQRNFHFHDRKSDNLRVVSFENFWNWDLRPPVISTPSVMPLYFTWIM